MKASEMTNEELADYIVNVIGGGIFKEYYAEAALVAVVRQDSEWIDERIEDRREKELARKFAAAARKDAGAFFDQEFDAVTVCAAVTGDFGSLKRWRQLVAAKGEGEVREAAFAFWREVASGEDVANRGSALNARLGSLPDQAQGEHETNKTKEKTK